MSRILRHVGNKDFRRTRQRQIGEQKERAAQKLKEWQEAEAERKQIEEIARPFKSDWREETQLQESDWTPVAGSIANSSAQTFEYGGEGGPTATFSGLGGVETYPSTVNVDGETLIAPEYSQLGLQGYAKPLGMDVRRRRDYEDVNPRLDASQEFALAVGADYMMNARVDDGTLIAQVIDGEKLLPQELQDILNRRRGKSPALAGTITKDEKRKIAVFMATKDAQDLLIKDPDTYGRLESALMDRIPSRNLYPGKTPQPQDQFDDFGKPPHVRGGGMIDPSALANAAAAAGSNVSDFVRGLPQPGDDGYVNPNVFGRLARSVTDPIRYSGNTMFQGNPAGRAPGLSNFWSPEPAAAGTYSNPGRAKGIPGTRPNPTGTLTTAPRPRNVPGVTRGLTGTPQFKFPKGQVPPSNMFTQTADDAAVRAAQNVAQKSGAKTLSKFLGRAIPFANVALAGADAANRVRQGDYFGAALGAATAIPGPAGWAALGGQMAYDAAGRPFMGAPATTPTSARGAGRSSFPTSDGNVVPKANKGFASDPKTGEPRYTGMNDQQYSDAYNKIADKYNELRAPLEREYQRPSGQLASKSLMDKINALNDAQTAEEEALRAKREAQENAFNDALQDYYDKQDAANQARQDALDEIDNEEDPYSDLLGRLGAELEKLRREGKLIKREEIIGPGEEGYVDTTNMANAIGYNRRIIYTAAAKELQKQILAAQEAQTEWHNNRQKRREAAEKADYSDAGGSSGKGRRLKGGQGGLPLGTTTLRTDGVRQRDPNENKSQSAALARQAAFARANRQQRRKNSKKYSTFSTEETTWSRLKKYR